jgi:large subunit ribosomal protein L4
MRRAALRSALSAKAAEQQVVVVDKLEMAAPKTKEIAQALGLISADKGKALILLPERNTSVEMSIRNLESAMTLRASYLNIRDLLNADVLVVPLAALEVIESILGDGASRGAEGEE